MLPDHVGIICTRTKVLDLVQEAVDNSRFICEDHYGLFSAPEVQVYCDEGLEFMYVPSHLHHMLFELLKNSLRAIVEREGADEDTFPPIKLVVAQGQEDITIKISDEGGGIPRSALPMVWTYMYTTAGKPSLDPNFAGPDFKAPMAGFGYGLPLSRLVRSIDGGGKRRGGGKDCCFCQDELISLSWIVCSVLWRGFTFDLHGRVREIQR